MADTGDVCGAHASDNVLHAAHRRPILQERLGNSVITGLLLEGRRPAFRR